MNHDCGTTVTQTVVNFISPDSPQTHVDTHKLKKNYNSKFMKLFS